VNHKMLALYGLKWNPFTPSVPTEALHVTTRLESFCWRVQQLAGDGGFALVTGVPGCGKSAALRILTASLATQRDVTVGVISRPQANIADFYREMGDLFGVELRPHNRWGGAKILRQRWQAHIQSTLSRPVLLVDEAQEMQSAVLAELRLLASADLDSHILLTTVLAGDGRLAEDVAQGGGPLAGGDAGVEIGQVEPAELALGRVHDRLPRGRIGDVGRHERRQQLDVLVVDVVDLVRAELADLPAAEHRAALALFLVARFLLAALAARSRSLSKWWHD